MPRPRVRNTHRPSPATCLTLVAPLAGLLACSAPAMAQPRGSPPPRSTAPARPSVADLRPYRLDASHSDVQFSVGFVYGSRVRGRFDDLRGALLYDERMPERSSLTIVIGVASINTGSRHRDEHLRSTDFFDAAAHPRMIFQSQRVERSGDAWVLVGPLTMRGVTREIRIPFRPAYGPVVTPQGHRTLGFSASARLARKDFGILGGSTHNSWFDEVRSAAVADSVDVDLSVAWWDTEFDRERDRGREAALARIDRDGAASVVRTVRARHAQKPAEFEGAEWEMGQLARALLARRRVVDALEVLKLNAELFPRSAAAHASLGLGYEWAGEVAAAGRAYGTALALDRYDPLALERRRQLTRPR